MRSGLYGSRRYLKGEKKKKKKETDPGRNRNRSVTAEWNDNLQLLYLRSTVSKLNYFDSKAVLICSDVGEGGGEGKEKKETNLGNKRNKSAIFFFFVVFR